MTACRLATRADLQAIVDIYNATIPSRMVTADTDFVTLESRLAWFDEHDPATRPLWVLERAGRVDGWLSFSKFYGRPAYDGTAEISVYVRDGARGQGLGASLLDRAIRHAPSIDLHTLLGFVFGHNEPSLGLFERFGFDRWGTLPGVASLDGVKRDLVILGRAV